MKLDPAFKRRCEAIAVEWRYQFQLRAFDPLPSSQLLEALEGKIVTPEELIYASPEAKQRLMTATDWSAGVIIPKPLWIVYRPAVSPARHEANLMHELAHVLLRHPLIGFSPKTGLPLRDKRYEDEAVYLGGCLQVPRLGLQWGVQRGLTCQQIAEHFGASKAMVLFRSNMTGIRIQRA